MSDMPADGWTCCRYKKKCYNRSQDATPVDTCARTNDGTTKKSASKESEDSKLGGKIYGDKGGLTGTKRSRPNTDTNEDDPASEPEGQGDDDSGDDRPKKTKSERKNKKTGRGRKKRKGDDVGDDDVSDDDRRSKKTYNESDSDDQGRNDRKGKKANNKEKNGLSSNDRETQRSYVSDDDADDHTRSTTKAQNTSRDDKKNRHTSRGGKNYKGDDIDGKTKNIGGGKKTDGYVDGDLAKGSKIKGTKNHRDDNDRSKNYKSAKTYVDNDGRTKNGNRGTKAGVDDGSQTKKSNRETSIGEDDDDRTKRGGRETKSYIDDDGQTNTDNRLLKTVDDDRQAKSGGRGVTSDDEDDGRTENSGRGTGRSVDDDDQPRRGNKGTNTYGGDNASKNDRRGKDKFGDDNRRSKAVGSGSIRSDKNLNTPRKKKGYNDDSGYDGDGTENTDDIPETRRNRKTKGVGTQANRSGNNSAYGGKGSTVDINRPDSHLDNGTETIRARDETYDLTQRQSGRLCNRHLCDCFQKRAQNQSLLDSNSASHPGYRQCLPRVDRGISPFRVPDCGCNNAQNLCKMCKRQSGLIRNNRMASWAPCRDLPCTCPTLPSLNHSVACRQRCGCSRTSVNISVQAPQRQRHMGTCTSCKRMNRAAMCVSTTTSRRSLHRR